MEKLGALWKQKKKKDGVEYLKGNCLATEVIIFLNDDKHSEKSPDYFIYRSEKKDKSK